MLTEAAFRIIIVLEFITLSIKRNQNILELFYAPRPADISAQWGIMCPHLSLSDSHSP